MALCLTFKAGERVQVGPDITIEVLKATGKNMRLRFTVPEGVRVVSERLVRKVAENTSEAQDERAGD